MVGPQVDMAQVRFASLFISGQQFDRFRPLKSGNHLHGWTDDASGVTSFRGSRSRRFRKEATQARRFSRPDRKGHSPGTDDASVDPGDLMFDAQVIDEITHVKVIRSVQNQVHIGQQFFRIAPGQIGDVRFQFKIGTDGLQFVFGSDHFRQMLPGIGFVIKHLPL